MANPETGPSQGESTQEREGRLRALATHADDLLLELNSDGRTSFVSDGVLQLLGYAPADFLALEPLSFIHEADRDGPGETYRRLLDGEMESGESTYRARHRDGSLRWLHDRARPFEAADGSRRLVIRARDVTDRRRAEEELAHRLESQREIARLSRVFLALESHQIGDAIERELQPVAAMARCDRMTLLSFVVPGRIDRWDWCKPDCPVEPFPTDTVNYPWASARGMEGTLVQLGSEHPGPPEAEAELATMARRGVKSCLCLPVHFSDRLTAYIVFERVEDEAGWSESEIVSLQLVGEIFASALRRRTTEGALRSSEERFRTITEQATELVAEFDSLGRYCYASPSYETLLGADPESLIGEIGNLLVHPDDIGRSRASFAAALKKETESHSIHRLKSADGSWRWFENAGRAYVAANGDKRFVSIGHDITDRVEARAALERQLARERTVAQLSRRLMDLRGDALTAGIQSALEETARLTSADRAYLAALPEGRNPGVHHEWCAPGVSGWDGRRHSWVVRHLQAGKTLHYPRVSDMPDEARAARDSIAARDMAASLTIPVCSSGETVGVVGVEAGHEREWSEHEITVLRLIGDILTAALRRQGAEGALRESQQQLAQAQKLEAVGRLAGGIAHDFNNLLTVILGLSRPILRDFPGNDELSADLREIHEAAERAASLTRQLLTFSRRHPLEDQLLDLGATLEALRPLLARMLGEDVELTLDLASDAGLVRGDIHQFEQVVVNLAANSRDAMPTGGTLRIETRLSEPEASQAARLGLASQEPHIILSVLDSGEGMDPETVEHIFDPFFTTKEPGKGTGLGLSIVYSVIDQARGRIEVESAAGKGSGFHLWLPVAASQAEQQAAEGQPAEEPPAKRILLVEDEPAVRRLLRRILERDGCKVLEAENGASALQLAQREGLAIDAVVTDVVMPLMSGGELARRLRELIPTLPILFVSGHPEERGHSLDFEDADILRKPFSAELLTDRLGALLEGRARRGG